MNTLLNLRATPRLSRKIEDLWQVNINNDELITRNIINISPEGIAFKAPQRVKFMLGQVVRAFVRLAPDREFECEGKVVWVKDQNYGIHFFNFPLSYDTCVMRAIHESELSQHQNGEFKLVGVREENRELQRKRMVSSTLDLILIALMTMAFIAVAVFHEKNNQEISFQKVLERAFSQRLYHINR